jgi:hypothetical protein
MGEGWEEVDPPSMPPIPESAKTDYANPSGQGTHVNTGVKVRGGRGYQMTAYGVRREKGAGPVASDQRVPARISPGALGALVGRDMPGRHLAGLVADPARLFAPQRLPDQLRLPGDRPKIGGGRRVGCTTALFPVLKGSKRNSEGVGELMLRHVQAPADCAHIGHRDDVHPRTGLIATREFNGLGQSLNKFPTKPAHLVSPPAGTLV